MLPVDSESENAAASSTGSRRVYSKEFLLSNLQWGSRCDCVLHLKPQAKLPEESDLKKFKRNPGKSKPLAEAWEAYSDPTAQEKLEAFFFANSLANSR